MDFFLCIFLFYKTRTNLRVLCISSSLFSCEERFYFLSPPPKLTYKGTFVVALAGEGEVASEAERSDVSDLPNETRDGRERKGATGGCRGVSWGKLVSPGRPALRCLLRTPHRMLLAALFTFSLPTCRQLATNANLPPTPATPPTRTASRLNAQPPHP